jgi:YXWGXW repeat-containing protein
MGSIANRMAVCALVGLLTIGFGRSAVAQTASTAGVGTVAAVNHTVYRAKEPPEAPAAKRETKSPAPAADAVWVPGYWDLRADRATAPRAGWAWVSGRWARPPVAGARWDPAHWGWSDEWWSWIPGHWVRRGRHGYPPSLTTDEMSGLEMSAP